MIGIVRPLIFLAALLASSVVEAGNTSWSSIAAGCVPDATSITSARYVTASIGSVSHKPGNTDLITLNCPVMIETLAPDRPNTSYRLRVITS